VALHVLVLAGGSGTRLWPLSRAALPKHLLPLGPGGATLLRATVERLLPLGAQVRVVTVAAQAAACLDALEGTGLDESSIIAEPAPRGTGPALGLAVREVAAGDPEAVVCSVHADHHVGDDAAYREAVWEAAGWAAATDGLATVGLLPQFAATGFGYVALGEPHPAADWRPPVSPAPAGLAAAAALPAHTAIGFAEKPSLAAAEEFVAGGRHLWNLGLFAWSAAAFERELRAAAPEVDSALAEVVELRAAGREEAAAERYRAIPAVAVEPLVLERGARLSVVAASFPWSDLGSWSDLLDARRAVGEGDAAGNVLAGDVLAVGTRGCLVEARGGRTVAVVGVEDLVVVDTGDAVLVVPVQQAQAVRDVVDLLRAEGRTDLL
jgi:mannose-1-phosphate guanylyltransferase/mannose-6-phosphate isomerase